MPVPKRCQHRCRSHRTAFGIDRHSIAKTAKAILFQQGTGFVANRSQKGQVFEIPALPLAPLYRESAHAFESVCTSTSSRRRAVATSHQHVNLNLRKIQANAGFGPLVDFHGFGSRLK
jgi:hypothetical protein